MTETERILCVFPDEINWPEGEDAPPSDAQELITLLLRQNPLERMGAGTNTEEQRNRGTASNSVRTRQAQQATVNSHVTVVPPQQRSLFQVAGEEIEVTQQQSSLSCGLLTSSL